MSIFTAEQQRENLEKLGKYLANLSPKHNKQHFRMSKFFVHGFDGETVNHALSIAKEHFCGTVACAVGHTPLALPKEFKQFAEWMKNERPLDAIRHRAGWFAVSEIMFGIDGECGSMDELVWNFLFGPDWENKRNTYLQSSWAAADRIAYYLDTHSYKYNYEEQFIGLAAEKGWITQAKHKTNLRNAEKVFEGW